MTRFRRRLGAEGIRLMEEAIRSVLISEKQICPRTQIVDTTAQPKHIEYPRDTDLLNRGRCRLVRTIRGLCKSGVEAARGVRSFRRVGKKVMVEVNKLGKDRQRRIEEGLEKLVHYAEHVVKRVPKVIDGAQRKVEQLSSRGEEKAARVLERLKGQLERDSVVVKKVIHQARRRLEGVHIPDKVYSLHEPHVACIRKGKRARPNEYGTKTLISADRSGYVVDHQEYASNPYDSELLDEACERWEKIFGLPARELAGDRGFHLSSRSPTPHVDKVKKVSIPTRGKRPHPEAESAWFKRLQRQRVKIEPWISHLKSDHGMGVCRYKGFEGDQINVSLAVIAHNLRKWGKHLVAQAT